MDHFRTVMFYSLLNFLKKNNHDISCILFLIYLLLHASPCHTRHTRCWTATKLFCSIFHNCMQMFWPNYIFCYFSELERNKHNLGSKVFLYLLESFYPHFLFLRQFACIVCLSSTHIFFIDVKVRDCVGHSKRLTSQFSQQFMLDFEVCLDHCSVLEASLFSASVW